jgi:hypothetical protein
MRISKTGKNMGQDNNLIRCGVIDTETGLVSEGYVENGEIKFKKIPWYKKLFAKEPYKIELIGTITMYSQWIWSNKKEYFESAVYKKYNPFTGKIKCIYTNIPNHGAKYFDVCAYEKLGKLIEQ